MKQKRNLILLSVLVLVMAIFAAGCSSVKNPYATNNSLNYTVSVKYDANGGVFTTNTTSIVDSYNLADIGESNGKVTIPLLAPEDAQRGKNAFMATKNGYFLAGWTGECQNGSCSYSLKDNILTVDAKQTYDSAEPVLVLKAVWLPLFKVEIYDLHSMELIGDMTLNPRDSKKVSMPYWDENTGKLILQNLPKRDGYTFESMYLDPMGMHAVTEKTIDHPGTWDVASGKANNSVLRLYASYKEGNWSCIFNEKQFSNMKAGGNYLLCADLDFAERQWPANLTTGEFTGVLDGNGHTIRNVNVEQSDAKKLNFGLFGKLGEGAQIQNLRLENVTLTVKMGVFQKDTYIGLLAGSAAQDAKLTNVSVMSSKIVIDPNAYFAPNAEYAIGLVCGDGSLELTESDITCSYEKDGFYLKVENGLVQIMEGEEPVEEPEENPEETPGENPEQTEDPTQSPEEDPQEGEQEEEHHGPKPVNPDDEKDDPVVDYPKH